jgi:hypothetical protein
MYFNYIIFLKPKYTASSNIHANTVTVDSSYYALSAHTLQMDPTDTKNRFQTGNWKRESIKNKQTKKTISIGQGPCLEVDKSS